MGIYKKKFYKSSGKKPHGDNCLSLTNNCKGSWRFFKRSCVIGSETGILG